LQKHIALLKLEAARVFVEFTNPTIIKEGKNLSKYSWDDLPLYIATMKEKYICIKKGSSKDEIFFTGEWDIESIKRGRQIFDYHKVHAE
tara:strand:+ start:75 stop:341 length:267 start_codon:yes stop_codon:yes gene_type:complete